MQRWKLTFDQFPQHRFLCRRMSFLGLLRYFEKTLRLPMRVNAVARWWVVADMLMLIWWVVYQYGWYAFPTQSEMYKNISNINSKEIVLLLDNGVIDWQQMGNYCGTLCIQQGRRGNLRPELRKLWGMKVNHHCQPRKVTLKSSCPQKPSPSSLDFMTVAKIWKNEGGISFKPPLPFFFVFHHFQQETYPGQQSDCPRELLKPYERHCTVETW